MFEKRVVYACVVCLGIKMESQAQNQAIFFLLLNRLPVLYVTSHVRRPPHENIAHITAESSLGKGGRHTAKIILGGGGT